MNSKSIETPAQKIQRLEHELEDQELKNKIFYFRIDISGQQYRTQNQKKYLTQTTKALVKKKR